MVHTTFQYGGSSGKRHRLREATLWVDPPEYYSGELRGPLAILAWLQGNGCPRQTNALGDVPRCCCRV